VVRGKRAPPTAAAETGNTLRHDPASPQYAFTPSTGSEPFTAITITTLNALAKR
jgi:hypothetical protein